ncbi:TadE family protein [Nocardioides baekrokdamisoli]|uniref:TadE family protein n=1 Tax=Nocardioides baekrokdamisoli TaxID=1804624 RepID=UPI000F7755A3|nr:TadE family protein [Nocardioides baekrokdamisoli]
MRTRDRGAATAELVTALPLLVVITWAMVWLISLGSTQVQLVDAARETARALARGEPEPVAIARGRQSGPRGTTITVSREGTTLRVAATVDVPAPLTTFGVLVAHQHAEATTEQEPCAAC